MPSRIRHCVECPRCHIFYLIGFSPYRNGSHLVRTGEGPSEQYSLHCFCEGAQRLRKWLIVRTCEVSKVAHDRGYGTPDEVSPTVHRPPHEPIVDISKYVNFKIPS